MDFSDVRDIAVVNYSGSSGSSGSSGTSGSIVQYYGVESPIFIQHGIDEYVLFFALFLVVFQD